MNILHAKVILCFFAMIKRVFFSCERSNSIFRWFEHENSSDLKKDAYMSDIYIHVQSDYPTHLSAMSCHPSSYLSGFLSGYPSIYPSGYPSGNPSIYPSGYPSVGLLFHYLSGFCFFYILPDGIDGSLVSLGYSMTTLFRHLNITCNNFDKESLPMYNYFPPRL